MADEGSKKLQIYEMYSGTSVGYDEIWIDEPLGTNERKRIVIEYLKNNRQSCNISSSIY